MMTRLKDFTVCGTKREHNGVSMKKTSEGRRTNYRKRAGIMMDRAMSQSRTVRWLLRTKMSCAVSFAEGTDFTKQECQTGARRRANEQLMTRCQAS